MGKEKRMKRKFRLTIDGKVYHAEMIDNPLVEQIAAMCPFEQTYNRYTEHEYYTRLPKPTSQENCKLETFAKKNQIWYFHGWNAFTILFGDCNTVPFEVVHLGDIIEDVTEQLENSGTTVNILCEVEE